MLQIGTFLLKLVVVILQHFDKFLEILNTLLVVQLDSFQRNTIVVRDIGHSPQLAVLGSHIVHNVGKFVNLTHQ